MMICPKCNSQVEDNVSFCPNCGVPFVAQSGDSSAQTTVLTADMYSQYQSQAQQQAEMRSVKQIQPPIQNIQQPTVGYQQIPQQPYQHGGPVAQLKTDRSFIKTLLLSLVTFGIYALICYGHVADDVNLVCSRYDGRKSMNYYLLVFLVGPITLEIATIVWMHNLCDRIGNELKRRRINYDFGAKDFWLWGVLGSLIVVGPFIFAHKFFQSVNKMNESFNQIG